MAALVPAHRGQTTRCLALRTRIAKTRRKCSAPRSRYKRTPRRSASPCTSPTRFRLRGDLIIAEHGSSYRTPPIGRILVHAVVVDGTVKSVEPLVGAADGNNNLQ